MIHNPQKKTSYLHMSDDGVNALTHCCLLMPYGNIEVNIVCNGLLPDNTKPLPEPIFSYN